MSPSSKFSNNVFFHPWIGPNYKSGYRGRLTLVLGESLPCCIPYSCTKPEVCNSMAIRIVKKQIEPKEINPDSESNPYYTKVSRLLDGPPYLKEKKISFWNSVSFYELVQVSVGVKSRIRPTTEMWDDSKLSLFEVLDYLKPEVIIIPGKALMDNTLNKFKNKLIFDNGKLKHHEIEYKENLISTFSFNHPSGGLSYSIREELLNRAFGQ